jgi:hypothetical protein
MFLCGLGNDYPTAINIANARSIVLVADPEGDWITVEWSDTEVSRSVDAIGAVVCDAASIVPVLMSLKERNQ